MTALNVRIPNPERKKIESLILRHPLLKNNSMNNVAVMAVRIGLEHLEKTLSEFDKKVSGK